VAAGQLPRDTDFVRTLRQGLHGTAMLSWDVPPAEVDDLIQYVKAFAPRWRNEQPGDEIVPTPDPWTGRETDGIDRGRRVYHGLAQCATACHPAYATKQEIYDFTKELTKMELREMRGDLYFPIAKDSDYGVKILPPDFTFNEAVSFQIPCRDQDEVDHYWEKLGEGGEPGPCGWLKDRFGLSWQVVPNRLPELLSDPDREKAQRVMAAMMEMGKIEIDELERAAAAA